MPASCLWYWRQPSSAQMCPTPTCSAPPGSRHPETRRSSTAGRTHHPALSRCSTRWMLRCFAPPCWASATRLTRGDLRSQTASRRWPQPACCPSVHDVTDSESTCQPPSWSARKPSRPSLPPPTVPESPSLPQQGSRLLTRSLPCWPSSARSAAQPLRLTKVPSRSLLALPPTPTHAGSRHHSAQPVPAPSCPTPTTSARPEIPRRQASACIQQAQARPRPRSSSQTPCTQSWQLVPRSAAPHQPSHHTSRCLVASSRSRPRSDCLRSILLPHHTAPMCPTPTMSSRLRFDPAAPTRCTGSSPTPTQPTSRSSSPSLPG